MILLFSVLISILYARCSVYKSVGEILKFTIAATHKINVIGRSHVAYGPSSNGDGCVVVLECLMRDPAFRIIGGLKRGAPLYHVTLIKHNFMLTLFPALTPQWSTMYAEIKDPSA